MLKKKGFTLLELMIVLVIMAILVAIAYPSYAESIRKGRRADAQAQLREFEVFAARQYTLAQNYACFAEGGTCDVPAGDDYYAFSVTLTGAPASAWSVTATPKGSQASDPCGAVTLDSTGRITAAKAGCWGGKGTS